MAHQSSKVETFGRVLTMLILVFTVRGREFIRAQDTAMSRISRTIFLQEEMEVNLRETFKNLFENFIQGSASYSKTFMFLCDKHCIDTYFYEYGITAAFLLAVLSDRKFSIYPDDNSPFYSFYEPAAYQWKENVTKVKYSRKRPMIKPLRGKHQHLSVVHIIEYDLRRMDFDMQFKESGIYLSGNYDWTLDLRRHPKTAVKMAWLFMADDLDLIRLLHNGLFRVKQPIQTMIDNELIQKVGENRLVCFHGNDRDYSAQLNSFLEFVSKRYSNDTAYYISGIDKLHLLRNTYRPEISNKIVRINKRNLYNSMSDTIRYNNQKRLEMLIDIHILKLCDTLISTESPSGILAARLRRREDNLYCYRDGVIFPCTRTLIAESFRDSANLPEYIDSNYYCQNSDAQCIDLPANDQRAKLRRSDY